MKLWALKSLNPFQIQKFSSNCTKIYKIANLVKSFYWEVSYTWVLLHKMLRSLGRRPVVV